MKKRRLTALVLAMAMCLMLIAACGGSGTGSGTGGGGSGDDGPVLIGVIGPFTGAVAEYGISVRNGVMLFLDKYNEAGGLPNGRKIETLQWDDEHNGVLALTGYNHLVDQGVTAIIGGVTSAPTMAIVPQGFEDNMPMITASATARGVTYDAENSVVYTNMFRSCFIDPFQGEKMADFAANALDATTAAVIFNTGVDYSIGLKDAFLEKAASIGLDVVAVEAYGEDAVDFQSQLTNIAALDPDVLFVPDYYETVILLSQQARNVGVNSTLLGADGWSRTISTINDPAPVEGSFFCSGFSVEDTTPIVQDFLREYQEKYGREPDMFAAQGYDAAAILVAALEVAEASEHETGSDEYRTVVIEAMRATDKTGVTGHITFDRYNNPIKSAVIIEVRDGQERFWGKF